MQRRLATQSTSAIALFALCGSMWLIPASASAVPKLDIKVFFGVGSTTLVPRVPEFTLEICLLQNEANPEACDGLAELVGKSGKMNSFDIPITAGYVPYRNPYFGLFLYGGLVNKFNIRGFVETNGRRNRIKFSPRDADYVIYQIGLRLGLQFDLGPVNFDFNYTLGLNSFTKTDYRTSSHVTQLNLGWLF